MMMLAALGWERAHGQLQGCQVRSWLTSLTVAPSHDTIHIFHSGEGGCWPISHLSS